MILKKTLRPWRRLVCATLASAAVISTGFAQSAGAPGTSLRRVADQPPGVGFGLAPGGAAPAAKPKSQAAKLQEASRQLKQANEADARKDALAKLSSVVNEIFDEDLKRRTSEVDDIRDRVSKLKTLIKKRRESKDRIVDLQFRIQVNEAAGLGFSVKPQSRRRTSYGDYGEISGMSMMMAGLTPYTGGGNPGASGYSSLVEGDGSDDARTKAERTLRVVMMKLRKAKEGEERRASIKKLKPALETYFAADLKVREQEIAGIQSRIENLDKQIERRRSARDEIISLQLEVLTNEADGLGFFSTSTRGNVRFIPGVGPMTIPGGGGDSAAGGFESYGSSRSKPRR